MSFSQNNKPSTEHNLLFFLFWTKSVPFSAKVDIQHFCELVRLKKWNIVINHQITLTDTNKDKYTLNHFCLLGNKMFIPDQAKYDKCDSYKNLTGLYLRWSNFPIPVSCVQSLWLTAEEPFLAENRVYPSFSSAIWNRNDQTCSIQHKFNVNRHLKYAMSIYRN